MEYEGKDDDIYVATYFKSGTTWMQMIIYQLTTDGNMNFSHIYDVSPWPRYCAIDEKPIPDLPSPRIIKTHEPYQDLPRGLKGKFIFVMRDGKDVAVSAYYHNKSYNRENLKSFDDNFKNYFIKEGKNNWFTFMRLWLENKWNRKILYLHYEDMKKDLPSVLRKLIEFCDLKVDEKEFPRILERSSFAFMKQHQTKFGEQPEGKEKDEKVYDNFIRKGEAGEGKTYLNAEQKKHFDEKVKTINWDLAKK